VITKTSRERLALALREVGNSIRIAKDTRRKQALTQLLEVLLKLQQANNLQRALKCVRLGRAGWGWRRAHTCPEGSALQAFWPCRLFGPALVLASVPSLLSSSTVPALDRVVSSFSECQS
jgi:hypothetical protein